MGFSKKIKKIGRGVSSVANNKLFQTAAVAGATALGGSSASESLSAGIKASNAISSKPETVEVKTTKARADSATYPTSQKILSAISAGSAGVSTAAGIASGAVKTQTFFEKHKTKIIVGGVAVVGFAAWKMGLFGKGKKRGRK